MCGVAVLYSKDASQNTGVPETTTKFITKICPPPPEHLQC